MNDVERNPYAASEVLVPDTRPPSAAPRFALRMLQNLCLAVLFCLSFLFLGCAVKLGLAAAYNYTVFFVVEYPHLVVAIVLANALLRQLLLPKPQAGMLWLPIVGGVASFCSFDVVHPYFDALDQWIVPRRWHTLSLLLEGIEPSFVGMLVEGLGHGTRFIVKRFKRKHVAQIH